MENVNLNDNELKFKKTGEKFIFLIKKQIKLLRRFSGDEKFE